MKKVILLLSLFASVSFSQIINFDNTSNWTQGSGPFDTYQTDHEYIDYINGYKIHFSAQPGLRETSGTQDGFDKTHNNTTYAWNLENNMIANLLITIDASDIDGFSFYLRRWVENPAIKIAITISTDNGANFTIATILDNSFFNNSSEWKKYEYNSHITANSPTLPIIIKIDPFNGYPSTGNKSILIDDFSVVNPLPVELTTFSASVVGNNVNLNWETATEVNNYGFSVERLAKSFEVNTNTPLNLSLRRENTEVWETLDFIEGHGNSNSTKKYSFTDNTITNSGKYIYRLKQIDIDGSFEFSNTIEVDVNLNLPNQFELSQNYPNPFNPTTQISFSVPSLETFQAKHVRLIVYDLLGREIAVLVNKKMETGNHTVNFNANDLNSGVYIYKLEAEHLVLVRKMILLR